MKKPEKKFFSKIFKKYYFSIFFIVNDTDNTEKIWKNTLKFEK